MSIMKLKTLALIIVVLSTAALCQAQSPAPAPTDNYVSNTGFKNRVFELSHRMPEDVVSVIRLLTSGFKGAQLSANNDFRTITVRDFPENLAAIEEAIKRIDKPDAPRPDIEIRMHVLLASNNEGTVSQFPAELKSVIGELQTTLNYKNYTLVTSIVQRTRESRGERGGYFQGRGSAEVMLPSTSVAGGVEKKVSYYLFDASSIALTNNPSGGSEIRLGNFTFSLASPNGESKIHSDLSIRDGEKVVVGTAGFTDKALILVMTARVLK